MEKLIRGRYRVSPLGGHPRASPLKESPSPSKGGAPGLYKQRGRRGGERQRGGRKERGRGKRKWKKKRENGK